MMKTVELKPFEKSIETTPFFLQAELNREKDLLTVRYVLKGPLQDVVIPFLARKSTRKERLWEHTCFELFASKPDHPEYWEWNLSPSLHWCVYMFDHYRVQGKSLDVRHPELSIDMQEPEVFQMTSKVFLPEFLSQGSIRLNVSCVLEHSLGKKTYWALKHTRATPDFHAPEGFIAEL